MEIIVLHNQTFLDIAIQYTGNVHNAFYIALANGYTVSEKIIPGTIISLPINQKNTDVLRYYNEKKILPATAIQDLRPTEETRGIGWMKVGSTFKVK